MIMDVKNLFKIVENEEGQSVVEFVIFLPFLLIKHMKMQRQTEIKPMPSNKLKQSFLTIKKLILKEMRISWIFHGNPMKIFLRLS